MNWKKIFAVIRREYVERIRTKAFWFGTALIPVFFLLYIGIQVAASHRAGGERQIAVVDATGKLYEPLVADLAGREKAQDQSNEEKGIHWVLERRPPAADLEGQKEALRKEVLASKGVQRSGVRGHGIDGYLILDPKLLAKDAAEFYSPSVSELVTTSQLERALNHVVLKERIARQNLSPNLASELERRVDLKSFKINAKGASEEKGAGLIVILIFSVMLYSTFLIYGTQNMKGVIDEKSNRIVEVVIASLRPTELMLGKILGIGLVGLTQYFIWCFFAVNLSVPAIASRMATTNMGVPTIPLSMILYFILFFVFGYFLYASIYTAIGAPFNTDQEAQQLSLIPIACIVSVWAFFPSIFKNPDGGLATFLSLFPLTSPLAMFMRACVSQPPIWQIALCIVLLIGTTIGIAWVAGRIYRIGILMYGKRPTIPEIVRWMRYSPGKSSQPQSAQAT
jgi:ABC-2 type transport system permease protein